MESLSPDFLPQSPAYQQSVHKAWKDFIDGGEIQGRVPDHILDGWLLSREARIDPLRVLETPVLERRDFSELCDRFTTLLTAAAPMLDMLGASIRSTGHMGILTSSSGHILATVGDNDILDVARTQYNTPGADRNIDKVGASAIGMALQRCRPIQICGYEHYSEALHSWRCASAPILADTSGVLAVLTISGNIASPAIQALAMVTTFANYIGMRVRQQTAELTGQRLEALLHNAHELFNYPLLVIDGGGGITHANSYAARLFATDSLELPGKSAMSLVSASDSRRLQRAIAGEKPYEDIITFITREGPRRIACTLSPVAAGEGKTAGMSLALKPVSIGDFPSSGGRDKGRRGGAALSP